jgi:hypothetical protein
MSTITPDKITTGGSISDILKNIQNLQKTEQDLITKLDIYTSAKGYTAGDPVVIDLVKNINTIANARISLFKTASANANMLQTGVSQSRTDLVAQTTLLQVVEDQLNQAKRKIDLLNSRNDTKMRMVQINTYYGQRYEAQSQLMKKIIFVCIPLLIVFILKKKSIIPEMIANYIVGIMIAIGAFLILQNIWDIYTRSNMDFNEYNWDYESPEASTPTIWQYNKENFFKFDDLFKNLMVNLGLCVGETCCAPGMTYDKEKSQCVAPKVSTNTMNSIAAAKAVAAAKAAPKVTTTAQGFTSGKGLGGTVIASYFNDDKYAHNGILPFSYDMAYAPL